MNIQLINEPNKNFTALKQILYNRGIKTEEDMRKYIYSTDNDINKPELFGIDKLEQGVKAFAYALINGQKILIIVDADCDGFTSSACVINFSYHYFPSATSNNLHWFLHDGKQHGLKDCIDIAMEYDLIICPDSASNDIEEHKRLKEAGKIVLVLDHHDIEGDLSQDAIIINNQASNYPNKFLSGVGVTWQFCRYMEQYFTGEKDYTNKLLDLVALGNTADMMSLKEIETKHLINKGFEPDNVVNPFIYGMWCKNSYKLGDKITSWGAAFYIAPLVNAIVRSGTQEEKELVFKSMLTMCANEQIPSTKRGHKPGEMETILAAALRICTNVKNHQTKAEKAGLELLEKRIENENMLNHKVLLFLMEPGQIHPNIAGLVANRIMGKYQRPVCVLTKQVKTERKDVLVEGMISPNGDYVYEHVAGEPTPPGFYCGKPLVNFHKPGFVWGPGIEEEEVVYYSGSARGCDITGITEFKSICYETGVIEWAVGHEGAFGLCIKEENIEKFLEKTDEILAQYPDEACYHVDYLWEGDHVDGQVIEDIAGYGFLWGKDMPESKVGIKNLKITKDSITLKSADKNPTICITLPECEIIKFGSSKEEYESLRQEDGFTTINLVGTCGKNEWNGTVTPQIMLEDYEIVNSSKYYF